MVSHVERGKGNWPVGLPVEEQQHLKSAVTDVLKRNTKGVALHLVYHAVRDIDIGPIFNVAVMLDWRYACVERALQAVAEPVWQLKE